MNSTTTNIILTIILLLSAFLFFACAFYLISNRSNSNVIELSFKSVLIPIVVAFGLLFSQFIKKIEGQKNEMLIGITEDPFILSRLVSGPENDGSMISSNLSDLTVFVHMHKDSIGEINLSSAIGLFELYLFRTLNMRYPSHWKESQDVIIGLSGMSGSIGGLDQKFNDVSTGNTNFGETLSNLDIESVLSKIKDGLDFSIPPDTEVQYIRGRNSFELRLINKFDEVIITARTVSTMTLPHSAGKTAKKIRDKLSLPLTETYRLDIYSVLLKVESNPSRIFRGHPKTIAYEQWVKDLIFHLDNSLSWRAIEDEI